MKGKFGGWAKWREGICVLFGMHFTFLEYFKNQPGDSCICTDDLNTSAVNIVCYLSICIYAEATSQCCAEVYFLERCFT